ncbi:MAG: 3-isopropylmalate dehydratase small subunit [Pyrinomonadaceae bacterium]
MDKFTQHAGRCVPLYRDNIDTDQIIPKQFLKRIERSGYGEFLFYDWRYAADGTPDPKFLLNDPRYFGGSILITGANFGCGSSREHAPWSLMDYGFRAVIAPSFADIFYNNSLKNGLLPIMLESTDVARLAEASMNDPAFSLSIDLEASTVGDGCSFERTFTIDEFSRSCLLNGLDDIGLTLQHERAISDYESRREFASSSPSHLNGK